MDDLLTMTVVTTTPATVDVLNERLQKRLKERELRKSRRRYGALSDVWLDEEIATLEGAIASTQGGA